MLVLPARLTHDDAPACMRMLQQGLAAEGTADSAVIDASALRQFDSSALAVLLEIDRLAQAWGRDFAIRSAPAKLAALAKLYGVDALLLMSENGAPAKTAAAADQRKPAM